MDLISYHSFLEELLVVLVIYQIDLDNSDSFQSINKILPEKSRVGLLVYDNSPTPLAQCDRNKYPNWQIYYISDRENSGVSKAYNEGYKLAKELNKKWLLLLDQDTKFAPDILEKYYNATQECSFPTIFAPLLVSNTGSFYSPCQYRFNRGFPLKKATTGLQNNNNISLLNSGLLISIELFQKIGGYNEKLKLDFSDFEFVDRYRKISSYFFIIDSKAIHGFSGDLDDCETAYKRFDRYCQSIKIMNQLDDRSLVLWYFALLRACKLSIKFKNFRFLSLLSKLFLAGNRLESSRPI
jgi:rhamnosyltransferase